MDMIHKIFWAAGKTKSQQMPTAVRFQGGKTYTGVRVLQIG
jgi:hypothetical protein